MLYIIYVLVHKMNWYFDEVMTHLIDYLMVYLLFDYGTCSPPQFLSLQSKIRQEARCVQDVFKINERATTLFSF